MRVKTNMKYKLINDKSRTIYPSETTHSLNNGTVVKWRQKKTNENQGHYFNFLCCAINEINKL
jgi:hypothetical protein